MKVYAGANDWARSTACCVCGRLPNPEEWRYTLNPPGGYGRPALLIHESCAKADQEILAGMRDRGFDI